MREGGVNKENKEERSSNLSYVPMLSNCSTPIAISPLDNRTVIDPPGHCSDLASELSRLSQVSYNTTPHQQFIRPLRVSNQQRGSLSQRPSITNLQTPVKVGRVSSKQNPNTLGLKRSYARGISLQNANFINSDDANTLILKANEPPPSNESCSLNEIMKNIRARKFYEKQFGQIQAQTGMHPSTLLFSKEYEKGYLLYAQESSVIRIRLCFCIGTIALSLFLWYDSNQSDYLTSPHRTILNILSFGIAVPSFILGFVVTFIKRMHQYLERITFAVFLLVSLSLIAKKPIQQSKGPILPLIVLIIPVFGITRMRFVYSCILGWGILFLYCVVQFCSQPYMPEGVKWDTRSDITYQSINYGIGIIGGMVSHYRQELLRRRNYALKLPFTGLSDVEDDRAALELQGEKFSKHKLLYKWTLSFRNKEVEDTFYKYWYLIDPFPFENPNAAVLHQNVFKVIRFAVIGLSLSQIMLGIQDLKLLKNYPNAHNIAYIVRYAIVIPAYILAALFMLWMGKLFYNFWLKESMPEVMDEMENEPLNNNDAYIEINCNEDNNTNGINTTGDKKTMLANMSSTCQCQLEKMLTYKGGYVRWAQFFSAFVVSMHGLSMAVLLLCVASEMLPLKPNVYFMGFLNSLLFAHRSGFRVRFVYATHTTMCIVLIFIIASSQYLNRDPFPYLWVEYSCYIVVVLWLGMMISHEEECLRRNFFILKSIRMIEFNEWFGTVLRIQGWVRAKLQRKLEQVKQNLREREGMNENDKSVKKEAEVLVNTSAYLTQASKLGVYSQFINIAAVVVDVITNA